MEVAVSFAKVLEQLPPSVGLVATMAMLFFGVWLRARKQHAEIKKVDNDIYQSQIKTLAETARTLSEELMKTQQQLVQLHEQNIILMLKLRESDRKISELEFALQKYV